MGSEDREATGISMVPGDVVDADAGAASFTTRGVAGVDSGLFCRELAAGEGR